MRSRAWLGASPLGVRGSTSYGSHNKAKCLIYFQYVIHPCESVVNMLAPVIECCTWACHVCDWVCMAAFTPVASVQLNLGHGRVGGTASLWATLRMVLKPAIQHSKQPLHFNWDWKNFSLLFCSLLLYFWSWARVRGLPYPDIPNWRPDADSVLTGKHQGPVVSLQPRAPSHPDPMKGPPQTTTSI